MDKPVLGEPDPEVSIERQDHCVRFRRQAGYKCLLSLASVFWC